MGGAGGRLIGVDFHRSQSRKGKFLEAVRGNSEREVERGGAEAERCEGGRVAVERVLSCNQTDLHSDLGISAKLWTT